MLDICMCAEINCPIQNDCLRHSDKDMGRGQTYFNPGFERGVDCEWFIDKSNFRISKQESKACLYQNF